jgi:hypothetical protein
MVLNKKKMEFVERTIWNVPGFVKRGEINKARKEISFWKVSPRNLLVQFNRMVPPNHLKPLRREKYLQAIKKL